MSESDGSGRAVSEAALATSEGPLAGVDTFSASCLRLHPPVNANQTSTTHTAPPAQLRPKFVIHEPCVKLRRNPPAGAARRATFSRGAGVSSLSFPAVSMIL